jgi:hypothetical protein
MYIYMIFITPMVFKTKAYFLPLTFIIANLQGVYVLKRQCYKVIFVKICLIYSVFIDFCSVSCQVQ